MTISGDSPLKRNDRRTFDEGQPTVLVKEVTLRAFILPLLPQKHLFPASNTPKLEPSTKSQGHLTLRSTARTLGYSTPEKTQFRLNSRDFSCLLKAFPQCYQWFWCSVKRCCPPFKILLRCLPFCQRAFGLFDPLFQEELHFGHRLAFEPASYFDALTG